MALFYFILLVGPLILFHELGHLLAAKYFDVKCERFSIGMGPTLASFRRGDTEYVIGALPFGGYVAMLGAQQDEEIADHDRGRAVTDKPIWQRLIIYLAGPAMNLLIPIPVFIAILLFAAEGRLPATVGMVEAESPAATAGLMAGDEIVAVDGQDTRDFDHLRRQIRRSEGGEVQLTVVNNGETRELALTPEMVPSRDPYLGLRTVEVPRIGIYQMEYGPVVHVDPGTEAHAAGLRTFDQVVSVDGEAIQSWSALVQAVDNGGTELLVLRPERTADTFGALAIETPVAITLTNGIPLESAIRTVMFVEPGSPAETAGVQVGDRLERIDGRAYTALSQFVDRMVTTPDTYTLELDRAGQPVHVDITPQTMTVVAEFQTEREETFVGIRGRAVYSPPELRPFAGFDRVRYAVSTATVTVWQLMLSLILGVWALITGAVDTASVGGPIMIADIAGRAGRAGPEAFMRMMGVISINLGVLNLLPIPGLDGGHLMLHSLEGIRRRPLSFRARQIANYVSFVGLVTLMIFVFKNDVERYWSTFANWLNS